MNIELYNNIINFGIDNYAMPKLCIYIYSLYYLIGTIVMIGAKPYKLTEIKLLWDILLFQYNMLGVISTTFLILNNFGCGGAIICKKMTSKLNILLFFFNLNKVMELFNLIFDVLIKKINLITFINPIILIISWTMYINKYIYIQYFIYSNYFTYMLIYLYKILNIFYQ